MNTSSSPKRKFTAFSWLIIVILFITIVTLLLWLRRTITEYRDLAYNQCIESQCDSFNSILDEAIGLGVYNLEHKTSDLQNRINEELDLDKLERCLTSGEEDYPEFDAMLRDILQENIYTTDTTINENRNSIFVIVNERVIASYTHDDTIYESAAQINTNLNIRSMIENGFYNKESGYSALDRIEKQQTQVGNIIAWQSRDPGIDEMPKYSTISKEHLVQIFNKYGIEGLRSIEILIPSYITKYGNIFGSYDVPGSSNVTSNNKIIIVQKLNLADYIEYHFPEMFDSTELSIIQEQAEVIENYTNVIIITICVAIIIFGFMFITYYNHKLMEDEYEDAISKK